MDFSRSLKEIRDAFWEISEETTSTARAEIRERALHAIDTLEARIRAWPNEPVPYGGRGPVRDAS